MEYLDECPVCESSQFGAFIQTRAQMHRSDEWFNFDQCSDCGLVFLNPRIRASDLHQYYSAAYLPYRGPSAWGKYRHLVERSQQRVDHKRVAMVKRFCRLNKDVRLLDIGCGSPTFLARCVEKYSCMGFGIDFSDHGWKNDLERFGHLKLTVGEIPDLPKDLSPDIITMWQYLEHDYEPKPNLLELRLRAKAQTRLIIEVPNFSSESRVRFGAHWAGWHTPRHASLFSPGNITLLLERSGWRTDHILTYGTLDPYLLYWMSRMEKKGIAWAKSMEAEFIDFLKGRIGLLPKLWTQKWRSLGFMTIIAKPF